MNETVKVTYGQAEAMKGQPTVEQACADYYYHNMQGPSELIEVLTKPYTGRPDFADKIPDPIISLPWTRPLNPRDEFDREIFEATMPKRIRKRPRDERGYPALFTTPMIDGKYDLTVIQPELVAQANSEELCGICGEKIEYEGPKGLDLYPFYFIGGPWSVLYTQVFSDPAMHGECVSWAMQVCPWLCYSAYKRHTSSDLMVSYAGIEKERPLAIGLIRASMYKVDPLNEGDVLLVKASKYHKIVKWWSPFGEDVSHAMMSVYLGEQFRAMFLRMWDDIQMREMARKMHMTKEAMKEELMARLEAGTLDPETAAFIQRELYARQKGRKSKRGQARGGRGK